MKYKTRCDMLGCYGDTRMQAPNLDRLASGCEWSGFVGTSAVQSESCLRMLRVIYLWLPFFILLLITFIMSILNVEKASKALKEGRA